jgi:hypothetical protein
VVLQCTSTAVSGLGNIAFHKDGREVPDAVQASFEFPNGIFLTYTATLANSFDANYDMFYGSDAAVMIREGTRGCSRKSILPCSAGKCARRRNVL